MSWLFWDHFWPILWQLYQYFSKNWGSYCLFDVPNIFKSLFEQKLWHETQFLSFLFSFNFVRKKLKNHNSQMAILWPFLAIFCQLKTDRKRMLLLNDCYMTVSGHFFAICMLFFHKTEVQTVILKYWPSLNLN